VTDDRTSTGIVVAGHFNVMQWTLLFTKLTVEVDGAPHPGRWRRRFVPTGPGRHQVAVYFGYVGAPRAGEATVEVVVPDGDTARLAYRAPALMTAPGRLVVRPPT